MREMNANELIKYFETYDYREGDVKDLVELCRQQQAEIEALKAKTLTYAEMLKTVRSYLPSGVESACAQQLGWSHEYMLGYNDALRETRIRLAILKKAQEK